MSESLSDLAKTYAKVCAIDERTIQMEKANQLILDKLDNHIGDDNKKFEEVNKKIDKKFNPINKKLYLWSGGAIALLYVLNLSIGLAYAMPYITKFFK